ncbi:uncharacterized protein LOC105837821 [Monomorium pharaonis]|uniref:uncharacterized protein LOC105837821 n=1 Tax=Monomorium pharaonis TaxID=307658 RepID=UPI00174724B5|nr:uncharacterized protein LOC105837821 [Monomorium pharaonis]
MSDSQVMDNLGGVYYLIELIVKQILIFVRNFAFREFIWFASAEEDSLDNENLKTRVIEPHNSIADFFVFLAVCGLLFIFMIVSTNSSKNEASNYDASNIETISMALEEDPSSFWYSRTAGLTTSCFHACGDSIGLSCDIPKMRNISHPVISNTKVLPHKESRVSNHNARSSYIIKHSSKTQTGHPIYQTTSREWLIRCTRSGQIYGKYPI